MRATWRGGELLGEPDAGVLRDGGPADFVLVHGDPLSRPVGAVARLARRLGARPGRRLASRRWPPASAPTSARPRPARTADMERSIAISAERVGSVGLYSSVVTTAPGARTRIHHHGECETSIWIASGRAPLHVRPDRARGDVRGRPGDFVYIAAGEVHVEENASDTEPLVVVISRNCPGSVVHYLDEEMTGLGLDPAICFASTGWTGVARSRFRTTAGRGRP